MMEEAGDVDIRTVEMHTGGEPLRIICSGFPPIIGEKILDKRRYLKEHLDHFRRFLMFEPRGHYDQYGALLVDPDLEEADLGVIFMHNEGYSTMCGHAVIALGRFAVDHGHIRNKPDAKLGQVEVNIQCPCGLVRTKVTIEDGKTGSVRFVSVPAFAFAVDKTVKTEKYGNVTVDIGYGGAFYALVPDDRLGIDLSSSSAAAIIDAADAVSKAVKEQIKITHPIEEDLSFLYGTIITDGKDQFNSEATANVCVFADRQVSILPVQTINHC